MIYRNAYINDIPALTELINRSYRGESSRVGWTTEADLLSGRRIDEAGVLYLLNDPDSMFLIAESKDTLIASIHAHRQGDTVHFGLFAVEPTLQGSGIGKGLLAYAEFQALDKWEIDTAVMEVITLRTELIDYYKRRGYMETGIEMPFPNSELWSLSVEALRFVVLEKKIPQLSSSKGPL